MRLLAAPDAFRGSATAAEVAGTVVGTVLRLAASAGVPAHVIVGQADLEPPDPRIIDLSQRFGLVRALSDPVTCVQSATLEVLRSIG
jgi:glycerate kinase